MTTPFSGLPRHRKPSRRTTQGRTGFYTAGNAASPKKPILRRAGRFSDVTDTQKNVTASGNAGKHWEAADREQKHREEVERLKRKGFTNPAMQEWTFGNDNGKCPQMDKALFYVEHWEDMEAENIGYLLWGKVGTGKSYFAGCIANALMEKEISVCMTNFALILNDLAASYKDRNEYIDRLCSFPLLILDDFGMERGTEYGLEQVYNVIDSRYRSGKPLIVTTNLTLEELQNPEDTPHARIYDRLLEMCSPVCFTGENFRKATAQEKMERLKTLMNGKESL